MEGAYGGYSAAAGCFPGLSFFKALYIDIFHAPCTLPHLFDDSAGRMRPGVNFKMSKSKSE